MVVPSCFPFAPSRWKQRRDALTTASLINSETRDLVNSGPCRMFTLTEMRNATNNFDKDLKIGAGSYGEVYRGFIDGRGEARKEVAIKCVEYSPQWEVFKPEKEIEVLSKLCHRHLVSLIGYCEEDEKEIIVYDYMARGTLQEHLYDAHMPPLPWNLRLEICIGAARCLRYLHNEATSGSVIHQNVTTSHILLDSNWDAKIGNFDQSILISSQKNLDVWKFGVVLLEILCARPMHFSWLEKNFIMLVKSALHSQRIEMLEEIIDPHLKGKITPECLKIFAETAVMCSIHGGIVQKTMEDVIRNLEIALHLQESAADVQSSTSMHYKPKIASVGRTNMGGCPKSASLLPPYRRISLEHIKLATANFHDYHTMGGWLSKICKGDITGVDTNRGKFQTEIMILSRLRHRNLLFLNNMNLMDLGWHLCSSKYRPLSWMMRLRICIGVARGLNYLHHEASSEVIIHGDVSTTNILLDENLVPKLSSFKRRNNDSMQDQKAMGTIGYIDPEYFHRQHLTEKSDVYSFGVVLFEVLSERMPLEILQSRNQVSSVKGGTGILEKIINPKLKGMITQECFKVFEQTTMQCLADTGVDRPTMNDVLWDLEFALQLQEGFNCRLFTFAEIRKATNDFDEVLCIGQGEFGKVYRGVIEGTHVVIKHANPLEFKKYKDEIEILFNLRHTHLVSFIGCYVGKWKMILIYEYMAHGNLYDHLYKSQKPPLLWKQRLEICIGAARGLHYLHVEAPSRAVAYGGVKTSNIFLDYKWVSKLSNVERLTRGSWQDSKKLPLVLMSEKSGVYAFGFVLFEVLCACPTYDFLLPRNKDTLYYHNDTLYYNNNDKLEEIIDPHLKGMIKPNCYRKFVETALKCLADRKVDRPTMGDVVSNLELALRLQECLNVEDSQ